MMIKNLIRFLKYEYSISKFGDVNNSLKYYYETCNKIELNRNRNLLRQFKTYNGYSRMSLYDDDDFELAMILWNKDHHSKIHNHEYNCSFIVMEGNLLESRYINLNNKFLFLGSHNLIESDISNITKTEYHNVFNVSPYKSLTLHVYDKQK